MSAGPLSSASNTLVPIMYDKTPLSRLLDVAVQKTYHDLYTMAEMLHGKSNIERKKELVKFACRTRQLFIRILAVVKWATTATKVNRCEGIQNFLERRARLVRETSDILAQLARKKLIIERLPNFPITDAVDALTLSTVNFLPERITEGKTAFVPPTEVERQEILSRLQQILTARLAIAELPVQYTNISIKNGVVILSVDGEFEVKVGVTSDNLFAPWHVYKTKLFLRDPEEPEQELVHPTQMQKVTNYIQNWLIESENPLVELYRYLHCYCQSLRLQILLEQAQRIRNRSLKQKSLHISNYILCKSFNIEYWKEYTNNCNNQQKKVVNNEKQRDMGMTIVCDDDGKFQIMHWPPLSIDDSLEIAKILDKSTFTIEEILNRTIYARSKRRFEELKEIILSITSANIEIDETIPILKCELLPDSRAEETLFFSISPFSGLYKVVSYMENFCSAIIEHTINRDQGNLIDAINLFKIWLIQQRVPSLVAHLNCRVYTRLPSVNPKNELIIPFLHNSIYIELVHNEGHYILVHISDVNQLLVQYYLLIVEKRSSVHEPIVIQQQNLPYNQQPMMMNDEYAKWIIEPLVICPLDPTAFLRRESLKLKNFNQFNNMTQAVPNNRGIKQARSVSILSLKSLLKLINYYDEMLSITFLKEEFQRKKTICKGITYSPWSGIPCLDIVRTPTYDEPHLSNSQIANYINDYFWFRIPSFTVRLINILRTIGQDSKNMERQWTLQLNASNDNYFDNSIIKTPFNSITVCSGIPTKIYSKIVDHMHMEIRGVCEMTYLVQNYVLSSKNSSDLSVIAEIAAFDFFKCKINYGPDLAYSVILSHNINSSSQDANSHANGSFDLRFTGFDTKFLPTVHWLLNGKLLSFLNRTRSLMQFIRLLHITAIPLASIAKLNCFNRPISFSSQGACVQPTVTLVPYTEFRWRLLFGQIFALDIQICGPNLILVRDGAYSVQLNSALKDFAAIPRLKDFLSKYADDRGLTYEFSHITDCFHDRDFILPELQFSSPPPPSYAAATTSGTMSSTTIANPLSNRPLSIGSAPTPHLLHAVTPASSMNPLTPASVGPSSQSQQQANSPSQQLTAQSPGIMGSPLMMGTTSSPMTNPPASQLTAPSPMAMQMQSPGNICDIAYSPMSRPPGSTYPNSLLGPSPGTPATTTLTSAPTPSNARSDETVMKQTSTLYSYNRHISPKHYPIYLSQQSFFRMLYTTHGRQWSKLESFLASSTLVQQFARTIVDITDPNNQKIRLVPNETDTYRIDHLALQISFVFDVVNGTYRIHFTTLYDVLSQQQHMNFTWSSDELQTLEIFFNEIFFPVSILSNSNNPIVTPTADVLSLGPLHQSRSTAAVVFGKLLSNIHPRVLRDLIKIIRLEQNPEQHHLWRARWCITIPPANGLVSVGGIGVSINPNQVSLFLFQFFPRTNRNESFMSANTNVSPFVVPISYEMTTNHTDIWDKLFKQSYAFADPRYQHMMKILNSTREATSKHECSLYPAMVDLVTHLPIPSMMNYQS